MARSHYRGTVYGNLPTGAKPLAGAAIRLYHPDTGEPWALPVYPDPVNGTPYSQPIFTNAVGELELWADDPARVRAAVAHPRFHSVGEVIEIRLDPGETATDTDVVESVSDHEAKEDPHEQYLTEPEGNLLYKPLAWQPDLTDYYTRGEADDEFLDQDEADLRYEQLSRKGMPSGYVPLDLGGLISPVYLPPLAITETFVAISEAEMLALPAQQGDVCVRLDTTENYILRVDPATVLANWTKLAASTTAGNTSVLRREEFTPAPLTTTVVLAAPPTSVHAVTRNGVGQSQPAGHYSLAGLVLTFSDPFELGERVAVVYEIGSTVPAPVNGYTKEESDLRYEPIDTMYTKGESDLRYLTLTGGTLTGALTMNVGGTGAATAGDIRLRNARLLAWRNSANDDNLTLGMDTNNQCLITAPTTPGVGLRRTGEANNRGVFLGNGVQFGPGSTAPDVLLLRGGVATWQVTGTVNPQGTNTYDLGTTSLRWRKVWATDGEFTNPPTVGGVALPTASHTHTYLPLTGGTLTGPLAVTPAAVVPGVAISGTRAQLSVHASGGGAGRVRLSQYTPSRDAFLAVNLRDDGTGWVRDDTAYGGTVWQMTEPGADNLLAVYSAPAGTGTATLTTRLRVAGDGTTQINAASLQVGARTAQPAMGGHIQFWGDDGAEAWRIGHGGSVGARELYLFDARRGYATPLTVSTTNGALTLAPVAGASALRAGVTSAVLTGWSPAAQAIQLGDNTTLYDISGYSQWGNNTYNATGADLAINTGVGSKLYQQGGMLIWLNAVSAPAGTAQTMVERLRIDTAGTLSVGTGNGGIYAHMISKPADWLRVHNTWPNTDNGAYLGYPAGPAQRFVLVAAVNGAIQTSHASMKEAFGPLDPAECATAVLETDWVRFSYLPPAYTPPDEPAEGEAPEEREARLDADHQRHAKLVADTAFTRHQKGYVLQSPAHKTHALFGLEDRASANASSDLAVVACALQFALQEIAALKAQIGAGA